MYQAGQLKLQYQSVDPFCSPPWAPISIGLEGANGFDGIQVRGVRRQASVCHGKF